MYPHVSTRPVTPDPKASGSRPAPLPWKRRGRWVKHHIDKKRNLEDEDRCANRQGGRRTPFQRLRPRSPLDEMRMGRATNTADEVLPSQLGPSARPPQPGEDLPLPIDLTAMAAFTSATANGGLGCVALPSATSEGCRQQPLNRQRQQD